jgi:site-specific recombinase XerD
VRKLAGHSSLATTQRYIEYNTEAHKRLIELI